MSFVFVWFVLECLCFFFFCFFFSSRRRHTRCLSDWSSDVCSSDLKDSKVLTGESITRLANLFLTFIAACSDLGPASFAAKTSRKFNISMFEAVFAAAGARVLAGEGSIQTIPPQAVDALRNDPQFIEASQYKTADAGNVRTRLTRARELILPH